MSNFRYAALKTDKRSKALPLEMFRKISASENVKNLCEQARAAFQAGDSEKYVNIKGQLPMAFWCGYNKAGVREAASLTPTQFYIIDVDHCKMETIAIYEDLCLKICGEGYNLDTLKQKFHEIGIYLVHETPSGGLRMVCRAIEDFDRIQQHQEWLNEKLQLSQYGDFDGVVKDLSRGSFMVKAEWILYVSEDMFVMDENGPIKNYDVVDKNAPKEQKPKLPEITEGMKGFCFHDKRVADIAEEYILDMGGVPEEGLRHAFYNDLVKNFRNICDNDPRIVFAVLPLCDGTPQKRWSQVTSICKQNNTTLIPKDFYFWLKKRGYVTTKNDERIKEYLESEDQPHEPIPALPPVFREFCSICPQEFVYPTIVALLPVMGTLSSYVRAEYMDCVEQSTTFFSCIWAPPSAGKGFAKRIVDTLMKKIVVRDEINSMREQLFMIDQNTKAADEKGKDLPHVMVRIMPAINSLPEFLEKMRDNKGYHMFTFAEEVDTFKKGSSSGGADKSDLFRTAWDNSMYGQSFKSTNTFKGRVQLFYNILLTGTPGAVKKYYSNVEDGMVTRISICEIENQQFAKFQAWKHFSKKQLEVIQKYVERCDRNTYRDPLETEVEEAELYNNNSSEFDKNVKWKFSLREKQHIDMSWLYPTILDWLEEKRIESSLAQDVAADVFRRRCGVKGFRLGMLCTTCWEQVRKREQVIICKFVRWFMERDLQESLKMFGEKYNKMQAEAAVEVKSNTGLFESLDDTFTKNDVIAKCIQLNIKSRIKSIIYRWKKDKVIEKVSSNTYKKLKNDRVKTEKNKGEQ